jgi:hypothetical protein
MPARVRRAMVHAHRALRFAAEQERPAWHSTVTNEIPDVARIKGRHGFAVASTLALSSTARSRRNNMSNFWDILWLIASTFVFIAYLFVMFHIVFDLFRDAELGGFAKALWIVGLIFLPVLTALLYVLVRGRGMADRQRAAMQRAKSDADAYIRDVAGKSPADQIAAAKALLDAGTITPDEFARLKTKALA